MHNTAKNVNDERARAAAHKFLLENCAMYRCLNPSKPFLIALIVASYGSLAWLVVWLFRGW